MKRTPVMPKFNSNVAAEVAYATACILVQDLLDGQSADVKSQVMAYIAPFIKASIHTYHETMKTRANPHLMKPIPSSLKPLLDEGGKESSNE